MEEFIAVLKRAMPNVDFENNDSLVDDGILDSLSIVAIISELSDEYGIDVPPEEIDPDNFNSAEAMKALVDRLLDE